ncbi:MAG: signal peptide peptidase SppA, partial [Spirochaetales bacterium]|nr:signal peptide peptidase SppA [Spirochaetales bacterium]
HIPEGSVLMLQPAGIIAEQNESDPLPDWFASLTGEVVETPLLSLSRTIRTAAGDNRISALYIDFSGLQYASLAALQELESDLQFFRSRGKKVIAWSSYYNLYGTYLASAADAVYLDPMGSVSLPGYSVYRTYYGDALERWNIEMAYFHAGDFKSYGEPFIASRMSPGLKAENKRWLDDLWGQYLDSLAHNRGMNPDDIRSWIASYPDMILSLQTEAEAALKASLIDGIMTPDELDRELLRQTGVKRADMVWSGDYSPVRENTVPGRKEVYVLTASGQIHEGESRLNTIGSSTVLNILDTVQADSSIAALVLRLDTGGGSAYASEQIRRKLAELQKKGKKVVVSMGGVTASGGYWIASSADELWTAPGTITGSIGVFTMIPDFSGFARETLNLGSDGVGTTWMSGQGRLDQPLNEESRAVFQTTVNQTYRQFLDLVAHGRSMSVEEIEPLAEGRIWTGLEAADNGLADYTGTLGQAVESAAGLAGLDDYTVRYHRETPLNMGDLLGSMQGYGLKGFLQGTGGFLPAVSEQILSLIPGQVYALSHVANR